MPVTKKSTLRSPHIPPFTKAFRYLLSSYGANVSSLEAKELWQRSYKWDETEVAALLSAAYRYRLARHLLTAKWGEQEKNARADATDIARQARGLAQAIQSELRRDRLLILARVIQEPSPKQSGFSGLTGYLLDFSNRIETMLSKRSKRHPKRPASQTEAVRHMRQFAFEEMVAAAERATGSAKPPWLTLALVVNLWDDQPGRSRKKSAPLSGDCSPAKCRDFGLPLKCSDTDLSSEWSKQK